MARDVLHYAPPTPRVRRWWLVLLAGIVAALAVIYCATFMPVSRSSCRVDSISGSTALTTHWFHFWTTRTATPSGIEKRFRKMGLNWTPNWELASTSQRTIFGRGVSCGIGAPSGFRLHDIDKDIEQFASDTEVKSLFDALTSNDPTRADSAINEAKDVALLRDIQHANADGAASKSREIVP